MQNRQDNFVFNLVLVLAKQIVLRDTKTANRHQRRTSFTRKSEPKQKGQPKGWPSFWRFAV